MAAEDITNVGQLQDLIANLPRAMSISPVFYIEPDGNEPGVCYHGCEVQEDTFGKYKFLAILVSLDGPSTLTVVPVPSSWSYSVLVVVTTVVIVALVFLLLNSVSIVVVTAVVTLCPVAGAPVISTSLAVLLESSVTVPSSILVGSA